MIQRWVSGFLLLTLVFVVSPTSAQQVTQIHGVTDEQRADEGDINAQTRLAVQYFTGDGVEQNYEIAAYRFRQAAEQGHDGAQTNLGLLYARGWGVPQSDTEAVYWYQRAVTQGNASAQTNLGFMYENGRGLVQNDSEAARLYALAAARGNPKAQSNLGYMFEHGQGVPRDTELAAQWYYRAAMQRSSQGLINLGSMYERGVGVPQNDETAFRLYEMAAQEGDQFALGYVAQLSENGKGFPLLGDRIDLAKIVGAELISSVNQRFDLSRSDNATPVSTTVAEAAPSTSQHNEQDAGNRQTQPSQARVMDIETVQIALAPPTDESEQPRNQGIERGDENSLNEIESLSQANTQNLRASTAVPSNPFGLEQLTVQGPRIALLIGNSSYTGDLSELANPVNDVRLIGESLAALGFDVEVVTDANQRQMKRAISRLGQRIEDGGTKSTGLFFYAGHGIQSRGVNYLIPIDAPIEREADLNLEAIEARLVLSQMELSRGAVNLVILDACRNMPLQRTFRSSSRGLARMDAPNGSFIAYSTSPGSVAADGNGNNSPFASALNSHIGTPNIPIEVVFRRVRREVYEITSGEQTPWDSSSLIDTFVFNIANSQ